MTTEDIAARYNKLPGFRLVSYQNVALPIWIATFDALVIAEKKIPVVDEFILRAVERGVLTTKDLAGFLGLSEKMVTRRLGGLLADDYVRVKATGDGQPSNIELSFRGTQALQEAGRTRPRRERIAILYDGIARRPILGKLSRESILRPQHVKQFGLFEVPALPTSRPPNDEELGKIDFSKAVPKELRKDLSIHQVLTATKVGNLDRRAREAVMLVYCGVTDEDQVAVRFYSLDARPMPEVDRGFQQNGGLQKLDLQAQLRSHREALTKELAQDQDFQIVVEFAKAQTDSAGVAEKLAEGAKLKSAIEEKEQELKQQTLASGEIDRLKKEVAELNGAKVAAEKRVAQVQGRALEPHEHVPIFERALNEAHKRLMIISPWIRDDIMSSKLAKVESLLRRKIEVYIGYGITIRKCDEHNLNKGQKTEKFFAEMVRKYPNMHFVRLGDTHAKVLVKDSDILVIGSFNWMSFGGYDWAFNGQHTIREEMSYLVKEPIEVNRVFERFAQRFARFEKPASSTLSKPETKGLAPGN